MQDYAKYRYIALFLINTLSAISAIVVGRLLIQALVSPSEIDTTGSLPIKYGQPKINCRSDICINEKAEELHTLTVQMVENLLKDRIAMNSHLVTMSGSFFVIFSAVLAWNAIEFGIFLNKQTVSCDDFLPRTHAHSHTRFSAARTSHARVHFAKI